MPRCTSKNVLLLVLNVLKHYQQLEQKISRSNKSKYYVNITDGAFTNFEIFSNSNKILLKSCLPAPDVFLLMQIFRSIYEHCYTQFDIYKCCPNTHKIFDTEERDCTCEKECFLEDLITVDPKRYREFIEAFNRDHSYGFILNEIIGYGMIAYDYIPMTLCDNMPYSVEYEDSEEEEEYQDDYQKVYSVNDIIDLFLESHDEYDHDAECECESFKRHLQTEDYKQFWMEEYMWNAKSGCLMYLKGCDGAVCNNTVVDRVMGNEDLQKYIIEYL